MAKVTPDPAGSEGHKGDFLLHTEPQIFGEVKTIFGVGPFAISNPITGEMEQAYTTEDIIRHSQSKTIYGIPIIDYPLVDLSNTDIYKKLSDILSGAATQIPEKTPSLIVLCDGTFHRVVNGEGVLRAMFGPKHGGYGYPPEGLFKMEGLMQENIYKKISAVAAFGGAVPESLTVIHNPFANNDIPPSTIDKDNIRQILVNIHCNKDGQPVAATHHWYKNYTTTS